MEMLLPLMKSRRHQTRDLSDGNAVAKDEHVDGIAAIGRSIGIEVCGGLQAGNRLKRQLVIAGIDRRNNRLGERELHIVDREILQSDRIAPEALDSRSVTEGEEKIGVLPVDRKIRNAVEQGMLIRIVKGEKVIPTGVGDQRGDVVLRRILAIRN